MTACFKLVRAVESYARVNGEQHCSPCVYFSGNLAPAELPVLPEAEERCGLGFIPGDGGCKEMRTDNCSVRKR